MVPANPKPTIGRIVHYRLSKSDAEAINAKGGAHNTTSAGDVYPAMIVRNWASDPEFLNDDSSVQLQVFYDGGGSLWVTSRSSVNSSLLNNAGATDYDGRLVSELNPNDTPRGYWFWPPRV